MEVINTLAVTVALPTDAYFSLLLKYPPSQIWSLFLLCLARLVPFIALCPFLGEESFLIP